MFILDEFIKDLNDNTLNTLVKYKLDLDEFFNFYKNQNNYKLKKYQARKISIELLFNNTNLLNNIINQLNNNTSAYFIINANTLININSDIIDTQFKLYTFPYKYKIYKDKIEFLNVFDQVLYTDENFGFKIKTDINLNNNTTTKKIIIEIPILQTLILSNNEFINTKMLVYSDNLILIKLITYEDYLPFNIHDIKLQFNTDGTYFQYLSNLYLKDKNINQFYEYEKLILTPLVNSLVFKKLYIDNFELLQEENYNFINIYYTYKSKQIKNYNPLYTLDLTLFSNFPFIYNDKMNLEIRLTPSSFNEIKVYDTDYYFIYNNNNLISTLVLNNNNQINLLNQIQLKIKLLDLFAYYL